RPEASTRSSSTGRSHTERRRVQTSRSRRRPRRRYRQPGHGWSAWPLSYPLRGSQSPLLRSQRQRSIGPLVAAYAETTPRARLPSELVSRAPRFSTRIGRRINPVSIGLLSVTNDLSDTAPSKLPLQDLQESPLGCESRKPPSVYLADRRTIKSTYCSCP